MIAAGWADLNISSCKCTDELSPKLHAFLLTVTFSENEMFINSCFSCKVKYSSTFLLFLYDDQKKDEQHVTREMKEIWYLCPLQLPMSVYHSLDGVTWDPLETYEDVEDQRVRCSATPLWRYD